MRIPKYGRHSSGRARVRINGRDYLLGEYGSKQRKELYKRKLSEWMASQCSKSFGIPVAQLTVSQLLAEYVRHLKTSYKDDAARELYNVKPALSAMRSLYSRMKSRSALRSGRRSR
jgi:Rod binding domain-containing protein